MGAFERRDWVAAEVEAREALAKAPGDHPRLALIEALQAQGRFDDAMAVDDTIEVPTVRSLALRVIALKELKQPEHGAATAILLAQMEAADHLDCFAVSKLFREVGLFDLARSAAHRAVLLRPDHAPSLTELGTLLWGVDDELAQRRLEQTLRIDPQQPLALLTLGRMAIERKDWNTAVMHLRRAVDIAPNYAEARSYLWFAQTRVGRGPLFYVTLAMLIVSTAIAASASPHIGHDGWIPRLAASAALFVCALIIGTVSDRRRRERHPELVSVELPSPPRSLAGIHRGMARATIACGVFFALVGIAAVGIAIWVMEPAVLIIAVPAFFLAVVLPLEGRKMWRDAVKAAADRS